MVSLSNHAGRGTAPPFAPKLPRSSANSFPHPRQFRLMQTPSKPWIIPPHLPATGTESTTVCCEMRQPGGLGVAPAWAWTECTAWRGPMACSASATENPAFPRRVRLITNYHRGACVSGARDLQQTLEHQMLPGRFRSPKSPTPGPSLPSRRSAPAPGPRVRPSPAAAPSPRHRSPPAAPRPRPAPARPREKAAFRGGSDSEPGLLCGTVMHPT